MVNNEAKKSKVKPPPSIIELEKNTFSDGIDEYQVSFNTRCWQELKSPKLYVMLISFIGGMLLASGHLVVGLLLTLLPLYLVRNLYEKERQKNIDELKKAIMKDPQLRNLFLTLMNVPRAMHTMDDKLEKAEWINDILKRIWPYYNGTVQVEIDKKGYTQKNNDSMGMDIGGGHVVYFERFTLGDKPPVVVHISVNKAATRVNEELVIELKVLYFGNCLLSFTKRTLGCFTIKGGVKDVYFRGNARIVLRPLLNEYPYFGGMSLCLLERPIIDYEGINLANLADNKLFKNFLISVVESIVVAPNKLYFAFKDDPEIRRQLKFAPPIGLCYFEIIEAENLPRVDAPKFLAISGLADPFCVIKVGSAQFQTAIVFNSINPYWGESYSSPIHDYFDQFKIDIYDKDAITADDLIGSVEFQLKDIANDKSANGRDQWLPIGKCVSGAIHFQVGCFQLIKNQSKLSTVTDRIKKSKHKFPIGVFSIYIYHLKIMTKHDAVNVIPIVELRFGDQTVETQPIYAEKPNVITLQFNIEESYHFICNNPDQEVLEVTVLNTAGINLTKITRVESLWDHIIGTCSVKMTDVVKDNKAYLGTQKTYDLLKGKDTRDSKGTIKVYLCFQLVDVEQVIYDNLQISADIQCNINQDTSETSFFRRLLMQPGESIRHPIKTLRNLKNTSISCLSRKPIPVFDDLSPPPPNVKGDCHVKLRVKWPERTKLFIEILRVVNIPVVYSDPKHNFSVIIKLGRPVPGHRSAKRFIARKTHKYFYPSQDKQKEVGSVVFNERLFFKVDPQVPVEKYEVHITLMVHRRSNICWSESNKIASIQTNIPPISFRSDPIEHWYKLGGKLEDQK